jgi:hypothetical protein
VEACKEGVVSEPWTVGQDGSPVTLGAMDDLMSDDELQAFVEALPSEEELVQELAPLFPERTCAVCGASMVMYRRDAITHSHACRQKACRARLVTRLRQPD